MDSQANDGVKEKEKEISKDDPGIFINSDIFLSLILIL